MARIRSMLRRRDPVGILSVTANALPRGVLAVDSSTLSFEEESLSAVEVVIAKEGICDRVASARPSTICRGEATTLKFQA